MTKENKRLRQDFEKTLSKEKLAELIEDYPVKIHEERDALLIRVEELSDEKRDLERELDDLRAKNIQSGEGSTEQMRDTIALLKKEQEVLKDEYEAELEYLRKQASGTATGADTAKFIDQLKAANKKKTDELERLVAQLQKEAISKPLAKAASLLPRAPPTRRQGLGRSQKLTA